MSADSAGFVEVHLERGEPLNWGSRARLSIRPFQSGPSGPPDAAPDNYSNYGEASTLLRHARNRTRDKRAHSGDDRGLW